MRTIFRVLVLMFVMEGPESSFAQCFLVQHDSPRQSQRVSFIARRDFEAGDFPNYVALGDFNGDGVLDAAVTNQSNRVAILLGSGDGTFQALRNFITSSNGLAMAVSDFNGDGLLDLAVALRGTAPDYADSGVAILLGVGDGSFQPERHYSTGSGANALAVGDLNGDGVVDVVVLNAGTAPLYLDGSVSVLIGNGGGSFRSAGNFPTGVNPRSLALGDFNRHGVTDLAVVNAGTAAPRVEGSLVILAGNGDGTFQAPRSLATGSLQFVVAGDFNEDGVPDLALTRDAHIVSVLLGVGDGTFQAPRNYDVPNGAGAAAVADMNGNGVPDLVVAYYSSFLDPGGISVLLGNGDGTFQGARNFDVGLARGPVSVGDLDGDGSPDIVGLSRGSVSVLLGCGNGSIQAPETFGSGGINPDSVAVGDFNGDGVPDLVLANAGMGPGFLNGNVSLLLGNGDGTFQTARGLDTGGYPDSVAVGDFNDDGRLDIAVAKAGSPPTLLGMGVSVLLGNGDGTFQAARHFDAGRIPRFVGVGDFNRDGKPDLVVVNSGSDNVSVLLGNGDGSFQVARSLDVGSFPWSLAVDDFNRDGALDLAVANRGSDEVVMMLGNGDGSFQAPRRIATATQPWSLAVGDFNADGVPDLAVAHFTRPNPVSVLLGNGDGSFRAAPVLVSGGPSESVVVADFNGDGIADLAVTNSDFDDVSVFLGNGDGSFQVPQTFGPGSLYAAACDFNGDGLLDLAVTNLGSNTGGGLNSVSVLLNQAR